MSYSQELAPIEGPLRNKAVITGKSRDPKSSGGKTTEKYEKKSVSFSIKGIIM